MSRVVAVVPARNESGLIGPTVEAIRTLGLDEVVVVDGGSSDGTAHEAAAAGARVLRGPGRGKGEALEGALSRIARADVYLLLDADLGDTAKEAGALLDEVEEGRADLAIAIFPPDPRSSGFGLVKRMAGRVVRTLCGFAPQEPLSGQRAVVAPVLEAVRPLAPGFGVEVAMTIDAVRAGFRVREIPVPMRHVPSANDLAGILHRARQGADVLRVAAPRVLHRSR
ncbi:MAG TPA: glycosyltransferase [Actinomycetota bacterium]|nr:glycosyltransferase [Actinomycetota bacterium]